MAAEFLIDKGFEILARNYRHQRAEIDLIARCEDWLLFVEVKTRSSDEFGEPEDFVSGGQVNRILDVAEEWIFTTDWQGHIRFDIITVKFGDDYPEPLVEHLEDAIN